MAMTIIDLRKSTMDLATLVRRVRSGEDIVIAADDGHRLQLVEVDGPPRARQPGDMKGQIGLPNDFFFEPLADDELALWSGSRDEPQ
jgi:antitoxin (DNA-binding transcriptional repressor) of toxin-antitoxin stability system